MALSSANAVSPVPAVDNAVKANPSVAASGNGNGGTFTDNLDAVLAPQGVASTKTSAKNDNDAHGAPAGHGKLSKLKNKLMGGDAGIALTPQQLQQQQAIIHKLGAANTGIDIPALRAALGNSGQTPGKMHTLPVLNPVTGKVGAAQTTNPLPANGATADAFDAAANAAAPAQDASNLPATPAIASDAPAQAAPVPAKDAAADAFDAAATAQDASNLPATPAIAGNAPAQAAPVPANGTDPSKSATHAATQEKLVAALLKTAKAPVLKDGQADGSKVPNAKIAHPAHPQKAASDKPDAETLQSLAVKIAATAGATNSPDTALTAAKGVAVAEVATRTAAATPTVTKIESAAMANATQTATHTPTPQAKIEAQALPVQFDAASTNSKDGDADPKNGSGDKSQGQAGSARTAGDAPKQAGAPAPNFPNAQPAGPAHTGTTPANTNLAAAANTQVATPTAVSPQIAATLHVSQQAQPDAPADQTAFAALGVAIAAKSKDGEKQFDINMHPADLGRVDVRISVDADGRAQAHLTAEHAQTLQLLQNDKATLERNLRDAGLNLSNNGLNFSLKGEQQPSTPTFNARSRALSISAIQTADVSSTSSHANLAPGDSRLDIRV